MRTLLLTLAIAMPTLAQVPPRPNKRLTPGLAATSDLKAICSTKWGQDERHVTPKMKREVCGEYRAANCPGKGWEIDHLISRELGGADDIRNLWAQPAPSYHEKDVLENLLHRKLCARQVTLEQARACLATDWWACYRAYVRKGDIQ